MRTKMTYTEFKKLKIDTSPIGWEPPSKDETAYFCTPKGAKIIGRAGVDGIHYCTVRALGETIFAVSPMNLPGNDVHPIARNMEDLLRLLLACLDMNLIEQSWMWDEEQLNEQIEAVRNSDIPVLFIHGSDDKFVPVEMTYENYKACASQKHLLIVPGAEHAMSYVVDKAAYENALLTFWNRYDKSE